ncbi:MAG TPA: dethiobiotin synthase [Methylophilaceae bacterium]|jgi:dethiobiotin synthetase
MRQGYFITGTDTGVGKTMIAAALIHKIVLAGKRVAGMKPVASGAEPAEGGLLNEDVRQLRAAANVDAPHALVNPYVFAPPIAPHLAARDAGIELSTERVLEAYDGLQALAELVVVEGAGGFLVPLNDRQDMGDLAAALGLPVVLVVGMRLGCINHALLSVAAIEARGLPLAGWVANVVDAGMARLEDNLVSLRQRIDAPCLGLVPHLTAGDFRQVAEYLDLPAGSVWAGVSR